MESCRSAAQALAVFSDSSTLARALRELFSRLTGCGLQQLFRVICKHSEIGHQLVGRDPLAICIGYPFSRRHTH
jgi:hypothetical protein